jgi:hypothetical protein
MRVAMLIVCGFALELGWLAVWPLSATLSHSALFTAALLDSHPLIAQVLQATSRVEPGVAMGTLTEPLGSPAYQTPVTWFALDMAGLLTVYGLSLLVLERTQDGSRRVLAVIFGGAVVFQLTLFAMPGVFSQDVFSYIAYGRLAALYDLNPYVWPPSVLRDAVVPYVADVWRTYPTPYAPLWVSVQWLLARASIGLSITDQALVYRGLASVLLLANLGLAWRLLGRIVPLSPARRAASLAALAWNPLLLFELAGNAHNDILMISCCLLGLVLLRTSTHGVRACAVLTLGALVKYLSGIGLVWLAFASAARVVGWRLRVGRFALLVIISVGISVALAAPWLELPDSLDPLFNETAGVGYVNCLPDILLQLIVDRLGVPLDAARVVERTLVLSVFAAYLVWEARRVLGDPTRATMASALARSALVYVLVASTSVQTWYFCLPLAVALVLGWRRRIARLTLAYSALALPALYVSYYLRDSTPAWIYLVYACAPLLVLAPDVLRAQRRTAAAAMAATPLAPRVTSQATPAISSALLSRSSTSRNERPTTT